jgi:hypothetical protein
MTLFYLLVVLSNKESFINTKLTDHNSPLEVDEAVDLKILGERIFALMVLSIPHLRVFREPCRFKDSNHDVTKPDFYIINTRNPISGTYIEVTRGLKLDDKKHQYSVMNNLKDTDNGVRYLQFNGTVLNNLQNALLKRGIIDQKIMEIPVSDT